MFRGSSRKRSCVLVESVCVGVAATASVRIYAVKLKTTDEGDPGLHEHQNATHKIATATRHCVSKMLPKKLRYRIRYGGRAQPRQGLTPRSRPGADLNCCIEFSAL